MRLSMTPACALISQSEFLYIFHSLQDSNIGYVQDIPFQNHFPSQTEYNTPR